MAAGVIGEYSWFRRPSHQSPPSGPVPPLASARLVPDELVAHPGSRGWQGLVSPDGKWTLTWSLDESTVVSRNGSRKVTRALSKGKFWTLASDKIWNPDSRAWVGLLAGDRSLFAVVQSLDTPGAVLIGLGYPKGTVNWPDLMRTELLGFIGPDRVLARPTGPDEWALRGKPQKVLFYEFNLSSKDPNLREYEITLPQGVVNGEVALSPHGNQLAWILYVGSRWKDPSVPRPQDVQLAISNRDGSDIRIIGTLPREAGDGGDYHRQLEWLPDGERISFCHGGARWSVPIVAYPRLLS